ncbi:MAG: hypothetical protein KC636_25410 [Myxococcales bacterium]|nr:hypothetical protein [Myxococcales bacterium]
MISLIGLPLSAALEAHDRFMLANRWHLTPSPDHAVERYVWTLLSFQPGASVLLEEARLEHDVMRDQSVGEERIAAQRRKISQAFKSQLAVALEHIPDSARAGAIA